MEICNALVEDSLSYQNSGKNISSRMEELQALDEILQYCKKLDEKVCYETTLYDVEVEENISLADYIFMNKGNSPDCRRFLSEMLNKNCISSPKQSENIIGCSCGEYPEAASDLKEYAKKRQGYLKTLHKYADYVGFMRSCFPNSVFSEDCDAEFAHIEDFADNVDEITNCLSVLDEIAVRVYDENRDNIPLAMEIIKARLARECSPDPKHKKELKFRFQYEEEESGKNITKEKLIECQPHLKLIRKDSDLRIYFYWKDLQVGAGEKVLIGRVGRHGWKK